MFIDFREQGERGEKERETSISYLLLSVSQLGIEPAAWICPLTRGQTGNHLVYGMTLQPTDPPSQGYS